MLVVAFVVVGIVVYQFTAPPPPPGSEGFSVGGILRNIRREMKGARETATADSAQTVAVPAAAVLLRVNVARVSDLTITGEDRSDIAASLHVTARGYEKTDATAAAHAPRLKIETPGDAVVVSLEFTGMPSVSRNQPPPNLSLSLSVPKRLAVRVEPHIGRFVLTNAAGAEIMGSRGETKISRLAGDLRLTHNGGPIDVSNVRSLKLTVRNSRGTIKDVAGQTSIDGIGGDLTLSGIAGPLEIEGRNTDVTLDAATLLKPPLRINLTAGQLRVRGLRTEARIDGRNSDISVTLDAAAPLSIYNLGGITVTAPPAGYNVDAVATEGRVTVEDGMLTATEGPDSHAEGKIRGGGPALMLRATRGSIEVRKPAGK